MSKRSNSIQRIKWESCFDLKTLTKPQRTETQKLHNYHFFAELSVDNISIAPETSLKIELNCEPIHKQETWTVTTSCELEVSKSSSKLEKHSLSPEFNQDCQTASCSVDAGSLPDEEQFFLILTLRRTISDDVEDSDIPEPLLTFDEQTGLTDVTFAVEGKEVHAHRQILALHSPVFNAMLYGNFKEKSSDTIVLPGKKYGDFVDFLRFVYKNKISMNIDQALCLVDLFKEYQVELLENKAVRILQKHISDETALQCLALAVQNDYEDLKEKALQVVIQLPPSQTLKDTTYLGFNSDLKELIKEEVIFCLEKKATNLEARVELNRYKLTRCRRCNCLTSCEYD